MDECCSARLYHCERCHAQVVLCSRCDRGHWYCLDGCAQAARLERRRCNARRYRQTPNGRRNNSERQRRFRERRRRRADEACKASHSGADSPPDEPSPSPDSPTSAEKVTHRGSADAQSDAVLPPSDIRPSGSSSRMSCLLADTHLYCHRCHRACSRFVRRNFLHTSRRAYRAPGGIVR